MGRRVSSSLRPHQVARVKPSARPAGSIPLPYGSPDALFALLLIAWFVSNLLADYTFNTRFAGDITLRLMVNNLFDVAYESNAWVYSYILGGERYEMDGYFPQAGRHFMAGLDLKF